MSSKTLKIIPTALVAAAALAGLLVLVLTRWNEISTALGRLPLILLGAALACQIIALVARMEAWRVCLRGSGAELCRRTIYAAGSMALPLALINVQLANAGRIAALRRIGGRRAPGVPTLIAAELPVAGLQVMIGASLLCVAAPALGVPVWVAPALFALVAVVLGLLRYSRISAIRSGLGVLGNVAKTRTLAALVAAATIAQISRIWLLLVAAGLPADPLDASAVLVGQGLLAQLPVGAAASSGASLIVFGSEGVAAATAAGLALTLTETTAAISFALFLAPALYWSMRRRGSLAAPQPAAA